MTTQQANRILRRLGLDAHVKPAEWERRRAAFEHREPRTVVDRLNLILEANFEQVDLQKLTPRQRDALRKIQRSGLIRVQKKKGKENHYVAAHRGKNA